MTCGKELTGNFCANCGEKRLNPSKDYSIGKFLEQTVDGFTHFDSKFLRSFKALLFKPGFLTLEFIHGRKTRYMKPVQIFIIASVLFYLIFPKVSTFYASLIDLRENNLYGFDVTKVINEKVKVDETSEQIVIREVEKEASHKSKAFLFLLIPFWGFSFYLLFWKSNSFYVPHVIFSIHSLSFLIVLLVIYYLSAFAIGIRRIGDFELIFFAVIYITYLFMAIRKVYQRSIVASAIKSIASFGILILLFVVYRQAITIWAITSN